nr:restriction endonuclease subunit S [uncultured Blautia sp.]
MKIAIKELGAIITGNTPSKKVKEYWDSKDICFVKPDIIADEGVGDIIQSNEYISESARKKARIVKENAIFVTCIGSIGKIGVAGSGEYAFNQQINVIIPNEKVRPKYLAYNLYFNKAKLVVIANAPVVPIINKSQFGDFIINIDTDINKQKKVIEVLDKLTKIIQQRKNEIIYLDNLIKARFVEMFGDPVKMIADGKTELVENLTDEVAVGFVGESTNEYVDNGIPYLRMQNIRPMKVISDNLIYINEEFHKKIRKAHVFTDDVVISRVGINRGMTAVIPPEYNNSSIGNAVIIRKSEKFNSVFLSAYITYVYGQHTSIGYSKGSAQGAISVGLVKKWPIIKANISLQNQFADFFEQVNKSKFINTI